MRGLRPATQRDGPLSEWEPAEYPHCRARMPASLPATSVAWLLQAWPKYTANPPTFKKSCMESCGSIACMFELAVSRSRLRPSYQQRRD